MVIGVPNVRWGSRSGGKNNLLINSFNHVNHKAKATLVGQQELWTIIFVASSKNNTLVG